jgi:hypothetical protein
MVHPKSAASFAHHEVGQAGNGHHEVWKFIAVRAFQVVGDID